MRSRCCLSLGLCLLLAGCGILKINIDYGNTPLPGSTDTLQGSTSTPTPSVTPTFTVTQTVTATISPSPTESQNGIVAVAAGRSHTCAVTEGGTVKCWGANDHGQLGNGTMVNSDVPVDVSGLAGIKAITAGWGHTCALTVSGGVKCWGYNLNGELGNGTSFDSRVPVDVKGLSSGVVAIDAGDDHTCAVIAGSRLKCWGYNGYGQLGDETKLSRSVPVESPWFGGGVADVAAGWGHTCVRTTEDWAKCWGNNEFGQLGIGKLTDIHFPATDVVNLNSKVLKVTADGGQTCALTAGGGAQCWGNNKYGQLGDGTSQKQNAPVQVIGLTSGVSDVEVGWNHTCAVVSGGELECWGWNYFGQLGDGTKITQNKPAPVYGLTDGVRDIAVGWAHTCVATDLGAAKCWGSNEFGQLGDGTESDSGIPLTVVGLASVAVSSGITEPTQTATSTPTATATSNGGNPSSALAFVSISAGEGHTCGVTSYGAAKCWGLNVYGQLGDGTTTDKHVPVNVVGLSDGVIGVEAGRSHTCALTEKGDVFCWGKNEHGQLGDGTVADRRIPVKVIGLPGGIRAVNAGYFHTCALTSVGGMMCWGLNSSGQLGNGTWENSSTPVNVTGLSDVVVSSIAAGGYFTCARTSDGGVKCWGQGGDLGDGTDIDRLTPVNVIGLSGRVIAVTAGMFHACVILQSGGVQCWGGSWLGDGTGGGSSIPVNVIQLAGSVVDVSAGMGHTCVLISGGGVQCWGFNDDGQFGNGTTTDSFVPVNAIGLQGAWKAIAAGEMHTCALAESGTVMCWGNNEWGQLGDGTTISRTLPVGLAVIPAIPTATSATLPTPTITCTVTSSSTP